MRKYLNVRNIYTMKHLYDLLSRKENCVVNVNVFALKTMRREPRCTTITYVGCNTNSPLHATVEVNTHMHVKCPSMGLV